MPSTKKISGIYIIFNLVNGKYYIGKTISYQERIWNHRKTLRKGTHNNTHLQNAWNKYGEENFEFSLLEEWGPEFLNSMEHYWCNLLDAHNVKRGYNNGGTHPETGISFRSLSKLKNSASNKVAYSKEEVKERQRQGLLDYWSKHVHPFKGMEKTKEHIRRIQEGKKKHFEKISTKVAKIDRKTNEVLEVFESLREAERKTGCHRAGISRVLAGKHHHADGFFWKKL